MEKMKHELEKEFKALALTHFKNNMPYVEDIDENNKMFLNYLDAMIWSMIKTDEIKSWIEFYKKQASK